MTCIVGYSQGNKVWIGGDSAGVAGATCVTRVDEKVFIKDNVIFGCTSSFRMIQLLKYYFKCPNQGKMNDDEFVHTKLLENMIKTLEDQKWSKLENNQREGGTFLFGFKGKLYKCEEDFQIEQIQEPYNSCGCGQDYAMGALSALESMKNELHLGNKFPEYTIKKALETAVQFSGWVRPPFVIKSL